MSKDDLSVEVMKNGALRVYTMIDGFFTEKVYIGYNVEHAKNKFIKEYK